MKQKQVPLLQNESEEESLQETETDKSPPKDLYTALITDAPYIRGDKEPLDPSEKIEWIDKTLIEDGINFYKHHFTQILIANTFALMFGFCVKPNSAVVMRTGKLHDPERSFQRYLSTIQRIAKFGAFIFNQANASSEESYKSFETVRKMHKLASKKSLGDSPSDEQLNLDEPWKKEIAQAVSQDLQHIDTSQAPQHLLTWDPPLPVSQFDMAMTQFGFIGTMWLFPRAIGIKNRSEEMKGIIHIWAIFGRLLGIMDEFNVCLKPDVELYDKIYKNIIVESLKTMDEKVVTIQSAFVESLSKRLPFITYKGMLFFGLEEIEDFKGENLWKIMNFRDKVSLKILQAWSWSLRCTVLFRIPWHVVTGLWIQFQFWMHLKTSVWERD